MKRLLVLVVFVFVVVGCNGKVVRDAGTYKNEVNFMKTASMRTAARLKDMILKYCECSVVSPDGKAEFVDDLCRESADIVETVEVRVPWHTDMMLYLAGMKKERPATFPPVVDDGSVLCKEKNDE